jgi:hypothetical protein
MKFSAGPCAQRIARALSSTRRLDYAELVGVSMIHDLLRGRAHCTGPRAEQLREVGSPSRACRRDEAWNGSASGSGRVPEFSAKPSWRFSAMRLGLLWPAKYGKLVGVFDAGTIYNWREGKSGPRGGRRLRASGSPAARGSVKAKARKQLA